MTDLMKVHHDFTIDVEGLTNEQFARLQHHMLISRRVFEASIAGMLKGVRKYGPEPDAEFVGLIRMDGHNPVAEHWFPHIFSEAVDAANQTALFADALGVQL